MEGPRPDLVEDQITYPIASALIAAPKVTGGARPVDVRDVVRLRHLRGRHGHLLGAQSRARIPELRRGRLPEGVTPTLGPDATGVGWVFEYALVDRPGKHDLAELRSLQDWNICATRWRACPASPRSPASAASSSSTRSTSIRTSCSAYGVTLSEVVRAVRAFERRRGRDASSRSPGTSISSAGAATSKTPADIETSSAQGRERHAHPRAGTSATVQLGPDMRRGVAELDGEGEAVGGIVVMRYGENALHVIDARQGAPAGDPAVAARRRAGRPDLRPLAS